MRLYTFAHAEQRRLGAEQDEYIVDLAAVERARGGEQVALFTDMLTFIQGGEPALHAARVALDFAAHACDVEGLSYPLATTTVCAPLLHPGKILCAGINYKGHQQENPSAVLPETPGFFCQVKQRDYRAWRANCVPTADTTVRLRG